MKKYIIKKAALLIMPLLEEFVASTKNTYDDALLEGFKSFLEDL